jgi:hypothetical protein
MKKYLLLLLILTFGLAQKRTMQAIRAEKAKQANRADSILYAGVYSTLDFILGQPYYTETGDTTGFWLKVKITGDSFNLRRIVTKYFRMTEGAGDGYFLRSDVYGNASWVYVEPGGGNGQMRRKQIVDSLNRAVDTITYKWYFLQGIRGKASNSDSFGSQLPAYYLNRSNHSGSQLRSTISDFWSTSFWSNIPDKPSTYPPSVHTHNIRDTAINVWNDSAIVKQSISQKGQANGYAGLGSVAYVPTDQLGSGSATGLTYLRGDQTWATPAGGAIVNRDYITDSLNAAMDTIFTKWWFQGGLRGSADNADSLGHYSPSRYTDTIKYKSDSVRLKNHLDSALFWYDSCKTKTDTTRYKLDSIRLKAHLDSALSLYDSISVKLAIARFLADSSRLNDSCAQKLGLLATSRNSKNSDSLANKSSLYYTDTTRFKKDSVRLNDSIAAKTAISRFTAESTSIRNSIILDSTRNKAHRDSFPLEASRISTSTTNAGVTLALHDFLSGTPTTNYIPKWNGTNWIWAADEAGGGGSYNPARAIQWQTILAGVATAKYASGGASRARFMPFFLPCSLKIDSVIWRGRVTVTIAATDVGIYDSLGIRVWSSGQTITTGMSGLCSKVVNPALRLGPGMYYAAWACSSASKDTIYGVAQGVAGQIRKCGYIAASFPLPASITLNNIVHDVGCIWMNWRANP